ncbi:MAG: hypothetical protein SCALA702_34920 [Melioribacteraceae bacterium]|nr:MAG: hypothetical protein SCALA702_34920 [Melioribacteraceae bacterium]
MKGGIFSILLFLSTAIFSQQVVWEEMTSPVPWLSIYGAMYSDSNDVVYFDNHDVYVSYDSAKSWEKIHNNNSNPLGYVVRSGLWNEKITIANNDGEMYQYQNTIDTWEEISIPTPVYGYFTIGEFNDYYVIVFNEKLYYQNKNTSAWDSLSLSLSYNHKGVILDGKYYRPRLLDVEVYDLQTGEMDIRFTFDNYIESFVENNGQFFIVTENPFEKKLFISNDTCSTWQEKPFGDARLHGVAKDGTLYKVWYENFLFSEDLGDTWEPLNIANYDFGISVFALKNSVKYAFAGGMKRYFGQPVNYYKGKNFVPMHVGNKYLYLDYWEDNGVLMRGYSVKELVRDSIFEGKHYYSYGDNNFYQYDDSTMAYSRLYEGVVEKIFDFNLPEGGLFITPEGEPRTTITYNGVFQNNPVYMKGFRYNSGYDKTDQYWAENLGLISLEYESIMNDYSGTDLIEAYIYSDSLGEFVYHTEGNRTSLQRNAYSYFETGVMIFYVNFAHAYDIHNIGYPSEAFTDSVYFSYAFSNTSDTSEVNTLFATDLLSDETVKFKLNINDAILTNFDNLLYKFHTVDKNLIPDHRNFPEEDFFKINFDTMTDLPDESIDQKISQYQLRQNYPNPFNPETKISYSLKEAGNVKLIVYDVLGNEVAKLVNGYKTAGSYEVSFNASNLPSGVYIYRIKSGEYSESKKMIILK